MVFGAVGCLQHECSKRPPNRRLPGAASGGRNESAQREIALFSNKENRKNRLWPVALHLNCFGVAAASAGTDDVELPGVNFSADAMSSSLPRTAETMRSHHN
jgi:hypothetical protein